MHGRALLLEGLVWRIGDDSNINIHHDPWIPRAGSRLPLGQVYVQGINHVQDLLSEDGDQWDMQKLNQMFTLDDVSDIYKIVIGGSGTGDTMRGFLLLMEFFR